MVCIGDGGKEEGGTREGKEIKDTAVKKPASKPAKSSLPLASQTLCAKVVALKETITNNWQPKVRSFNRCCRKLFEEVEEMA